MIEIIRHRRRLELADTQDNRNTLTRYRDPETGLHYVGLCRWDPMMEDSPTNSRTERP